MKTRIEEKLNSYAENLLEKSDLNTDEVNFLVFWMNRLEAKEQFELSKKQEVKMKEEKAKSNEAWKQSIYAMLENIAK